MRNCPHSKNSIVTLTINLSCWLQMSEPIWCMDTVNCEDGMIMWKKVGWEWGKDCHVVLPHIVTHFVHSSESEINCQSLWRFPFYSVHLAWLVICYLNCRWVNIWYTHTWTRLIAMTAWVEGHLNYGKHIPAMQAILSLL